TLPAYRSTLACTRSSSARTGAPGGRHAPKRPASVAAAYAGYSRADTRCSVARMSVAFTSAPVSMARVSCSRSNPASRDQSETDAVLLAEIALQRRATVLEQRDDDVAVTCGALRLHDDVIAVVDVVLDHRLAADAQHERVLATSGHLAGDRHVLIPVLVRVDR